jgi:hypothetical protein
MENGGRRETGSDRQKEDPGDEKKPEKDEEGVVVRDAKRKRIRSDAWEGKTRTAGLEGRERPWRFSVIFLSWRVKE